jgi:hypothetical protein
MTMFADVPEGSRDAARARFIDYRGQRILLLDYSGLQAEAEILALIEETSALIARQKPGTVRTLTAVEGAKIASPQIARAFRDAAEHNAPYVQAAAVVGLSAQQRVVYEAVMLFSGRKLHSFDDPERALDWLAAQQDPVA